MKQKIILLVLLSSVLNGVVKGQIHKGGFGNFFVGPSYSITTSLQNDLRSANLPGGAVQLNKFAILFGGAGYSVRSSGVVLGGSGITYQTSSQQADGEVTFENGAGFFNMGYCVVNKDNKLGFTYVGIGWHGAKFRIFNATTDRIFIIGKDTVAGSEAADFRKEGFAFEAGYALKYFLFDEEDNKDGKIFMTVVGIDAGISVFPALQNWKGSTEIMSMEKPFATLIYCRVSLGFGSFHKKEK